MLASLVGGASPAFAASLPELRAAANAAPQDPDALFAWGVAALRSEHPDQAWEAYGRLAKLEPGFGLRRAAREEAGLRQRPGDLEARYRLAAAYYAAGRRDAARRTLQTLCQRFPDESWGWVYLGYLNLELAKLDEASRCGEQALRLTPRLGSAHFLIAQVRYRQGAFQPAREALEALSGGRIGRSPLEGARP